MGKVTSEGMNSQRDQTANSPRNVSTLQISSKAFSSIMRYI